MHVVHGYTWELPVRTWESFEFKMGATHNNSTVNKTLLFLLLLVFLMVFSQLYI